MKLLFIHQNFPGQFRHLAPALARRGDAVRALGITAQDVPGVALRRYKPERGTSKTVHPLAAEFETKVIRGEACAREMLAMRAEGWHPDAVIAHPGWGEALFVKDVWPDVPLLSFIEYHYASDGGDVGFDPEFGVTDDFLQRARVRAKNANSLLALDAMDAGLSPTRWQRSTVPIEYRDKVHVIFDGIDTARVRPDPQATVRLSPGTARERVLRAGDEVVTFVNRNLEPYRGYHVFMRALPELLAARPEAVVVIVGNDGVSYGAKPADGVSYKERFLAEVRERIDESRVYFVGHLAYPDLVRLFQVSACHVYLTYPFVLSWSCLEAMSAGALVVGSATPPVEEVIEHGRNGLLVDFFDVTAIAGTVAAVLGDPARYRPLREAARATVRERYDLATVCLPQQVALVDALAHGALAHGALSQGALSQGAPSGTHRGPAAAPAPVKPSP